MMIKILAVFLVLAVCSTHAASNKMRAHRLKRTVGMALDDPVPPVDPAAAAPVDPALAAAPVDPAAAAAAVPAAGPPVSDLALPPPPPPVGGSVSLATPGNSPAAAQTAELDKQIAGAMARYNELDNQISLDTTTSQDWFEVLQNYQFKYSALLQRIKANSDKKDELNGLITKLKDAATSSQANREIDSLRAHLGSLVFNAKASGDDENAGVYEELEGTLGEMATKLDPVASTTISTAINDVAPNIGSVADGGIPGPSSDAIKALPEAGEEGDGDGDEE